MASAIAPLLSSLTDEWPTPPEIVEALSVRYGPFTLDPCARPETAKAPKFYTVDDDGLSQDWSGETVFCNPPYGRQIASWVAKAYDSARCGGARVVLLIPARTDTRYWHDYVMRSDVVLLVKGRIRFGDADAAAPFPSAVIVFDRSGESASPRVAAWLPPRGDRRG